MLGLSLTNTYKIQFVELTFFQLTFANVYDRIDLHVFLFPMYIVGFT
jgi:hypothetical protein